MAVGDAHVFPGFLTPVLTQLFLPKPPTTFLTCFRRGERRKYAGKKSWLNRGSNSQPPGHDSDTLTTEHICCNIWKLDIHAYFNNLHDFCCTTIFFCLSFPIIIAPRRLAVGRAYLLTSCHSCFVSAFSAFSFDALDLRQMYLVL